jgi:hypothetical protein
MAASTPSNSGLPEGITKTKNIYEIDISPPPAASWWTDWGGSYDEYTGTQIALYFERFLSQAESIGELVDYTLYIDTSTYIVYFNIPKHPWLYADYAAESENLIPFISSALDEDDPSNNYIRDVNAETRLGIPSFTVKLSDSISGITLNQSFSIEIDNHDGYFDDDALWDLFNTPVYLKKAVTEKPAYENFMEIRSGFVGSTKITFDRFQINVDDKLRNMDEPVCNLIDQKDFAFPLVAEATGKNIPVLYGTKKIKLLKLDNENRFIAAEFVSALGGVYDKDGNPVSASIDGNVITAANAVSAVVTGYTANNIGEIIKDLVTRKTGIQYVSSNWNFEEVDAYTAIAPDINILFSQGDVKKAVQEAIKSDMAYFIQQSGGKFTIRKWGEVYGTHEIPSWAATKTPEKNYDKAQENYFSSCTVKYNFSDVDKNTYDTCLYDEAETGAEDRYRKRRVSEYETDLITEQAARNLAVLLSGRYSSMSQTMNLAVGVDTTSFELLDMVFFAPEINDRIFSRAEVFIITAINPAQDILTMEEVDFRDLDEMNPMFDNSNYEEDYDQLYAYTDNSEYEILVDGGNA